MHIHRKIWLLSFVALVVMDTAIVAAFVAMRRPLSPGQWSFLESQRPHIVVTPTGIIANLNICADCLDFALARRELGGREYGVGKLLEVTNVPAVLVARATFHSLQERPRGSSRRNSDIATLAFACMLLGECAIGAAFISLRSGPAV